MAINIRNDYIERNIENIRKKIMQELGISKLSKPQTINILIDDYNNKHTKIKHKGEYL